MSDIQIIIKAIDQASSVFRKVGTESSFLDSSFNNLGKSSLSASKSISNALSPAIRGSSVSANSFNQSLGPLNNRMNETRTVSTGTGVSLRSLGLAVGAASAVAAAGVVAWRATVGSLIDYNKSILDASRATRMGVEDLSRFVQVGDDMGVGIDSITRALQMATKNGFAPSISAIADLADRANAMSTSTERAEMLAKMFGRNWAELDPILQLGGQRIRELAAAQRDGLVVTEAEIAKSEELRLKIDVLADSWTSYKNELAGKVIPAVIDYLDKATEQAGISEDLKRAGELNIATYTEQSYALTRMAMDDMSYVDAIRAELAAHDANNAAMMTALGPVEALRIANLGLGTSAGKAQEAIEELTAAELLRQVAEAIMAGDNKGAKALYDTYLQAKSAEDSITAVINGLIKLNGMTSTAYIDIITLGGGAGGVGKFGPDTGQVSGWKKDYPGGWIQGGHIWTSRGDTGRVPYAQGGDFIVPPGFSNDSYPMAVQSGERVQITPAGEKSKSGANVTINVTSSPLDTQYMTQAIKRAVGM